MSEMIRYKIPPALIRIIRDYLCDRRARTNLHEITLEKGCPQGSVLGPLLWNLAYNHIIEKMLEQKMGIICYADDTILITRSPSLEKAKERVRTSTLLIAELLAVSGLKLNIEKTEIVIFKGGGTSRKGTVTETFEICERKVESKLCMKYLGVYIDALLTFNAHFEYLRKKCKVLIPKVTAVCQNTCGYSSVARKTMFQATVGAIFKYASSVFAHRCAANRKAIEEIDKLVLRTTGRLYRTVGMYPASVISGKIPLELDIIR